MKTTQIIEALLFASDAPLSVDDLARGEEDLDAAGVEAAIAALRLEYEEQGRAFQIYELAGGYQLLTRPEYSPHLERFETVPRSTRLSSAALEVLAIIAYRQPLGRAEVEEIRGVQSAHVLRTLHELGLIDVVARGEGLGRPLLYGTTAKFLEHFGFASLDDLPKPDELPVVLAQRPLGGRAEAAGSPDEETDVGDAATDVGDMVDVGQTAAAADAQSPSPPVPQSDGEDGMEAGAEAEVGSGDEAEEPSGTV